MTNFDYLYNQNHYGETLHKESFLPKKRYFKIIENATILPHRHLNVNGKGT